jgi:hypothetical protein
LHQKETVFRCPYRFARDDQRLRLAADANRLAASGLYERRIPKELAFYLFMPSF